MSFGRRRRRNSHSQRSLPPCLWRRRRRFQIQTVMTSLRWTPGTSLSKASYHASRLLPGQHSHGPAGSLCETADGSPVLPSTSLLPGLAFAALSILGVSVFSFACLGARVSDRKGWSRVLCQSASSQIQMCVLTCQLCLLPGMPSKMSTMSMVCPRPSLVACSPIMLWPMLSPRGWISSQRLWSMVSSNSTR